MGSVVGEVVSSFGHRLGKAVSFGHMKSSKSVTFHVAAETAGQRTGIVDFIYVVQPPNSVTGRLLSVYRYTRGLFKIGCVDCYVQGSIHVTGHLLVRDVTRIWHRTHC